jgi:hypothetical protein
MPPSPPLRCALRSLRRRLRRRLRHILNCANVQSLAGYPLVATYLN